VSSGFTDEVKQELARVPFGTPRIARVELAALLRFGGALVVSGGTPRSVALDLETVSGATARRTFALVQHLYDLAPELRVRAPGGVRARSVYGVRVDLGASGIGRDLGLIDDHGLPTVAPVVTAHDAAQAQVRGAFLAAGSVSSPGRPPHLEVTAHHHAAAEALAVAVRSLTEGGVSVSATQVDRPRVVVKSGATIGELLAGLGATSAFLRFDDQRLRRQLRGDATRLANADAANLARTVAAASAQVRAVERVVAATGWDELDPDLRAVALVRLTNPEASLTELGQLTDPELSRSAVHRRLKRLEQLAEDLPAPGSRTGSGTSSSGR
jgi:cell division protein WhiA